MVGKKYTFGWFLRNGVLWLVIFVMLFPLLHMLAVTFSDKLSVMQSRVYFWPKGWNLEAYKFILNYELIFTAYKNTIIYVVCGTAIALFVLVTGAYALEARSAVPSASRSTF